MPTGLSYVDSATTVEWTESFLMTSSPLHTSGRISLKRPFMIETDHISRRWLTQFKNTEYMVGRGEAYPVS